MKLSEAKSVGKKIIFVAFCLILFLIFTALSYADISPKYKKLRGDGWQDHSPPIPNDLNSEVNLSSVNNVVNITTVVLVRFGNNNLIFTQHKKQSTSDKRSPNFSNKK